MGSGIDVNTWTQQAMISDADFAYIHGLINPFLYGNPFPGFDYIVESISERGCDPSPIPGRTDHRLPRSAFSSFPISIACAFSFILTFVRDHHSEKPMLTHPLDLPGDGRFRLYLYLLVAARFFHRHPLRAKGAIRRIIAVDGLLGEGTEGDGKISFTSASIHDGTNPNDTSPQIFY